MKFISALIILSYFMASNFVVASDRSASISDSVKVGEFSYQDLTQIGTDSSVINQIYLEEFEFFLNQTLAMQSNLNMVEEGFAEQVIVGRLTKVDNHGGALVELGIAKHGRIALGIDDVPGMVALEVTLDGSENAMANIVDQMKQMIVFSVGRSGALQVTKKAIATR